MERVFCYVEETIPSQCTHELRRIYRTAPYVKKYKYCIIFDVFNSLRQKDHNTYEY